MSSYSERLAARIAQTGSHLCVGIDPRMDRIAEPLDDWLARIVESTAPQAAAFKPNMAYFEALGLPGIASLERLIEALIPKDIPIILDCKRGDIAATQEAYAQAYFGRWEVDAVTLSPYMGFDSLEPFLKHPGTASYALALTSNPGAADLQTRDCEGQPLYERVLAFTERAADLPGELGFVLGLTNLDAETLRRVPEAPLLIPGFGAQGGALAGLPLGERRAPWVINASRAVLYGPDGGATPAERARTLKERIRDELG